MDVDILISGIALWPSLPSMTTIQTYQSFYWRRAKAETFSKWVVLFDTLESLYPNIIFVVILWRKPHEFVFFYFYWFIHNISVMSTHCIFICILSISTRLKRHLFVNDIPVKWCSIKRFDSRLLLKYVKILRMSETETEWLKMKERN